MAYYGETLMRGLQAVQSVGAIAGGLEDLKMRKLERETLEKKEVWLDEWVDLKTRPFYMALKDSPDKQAFLDKMFASYVNPRGQIQRRSILLAGKSAMWNKQIIDSLEVDVIPADLRKLRKIFEKKEKIKTERSEFDPEYIKLNREYETLGKAIRVETGAVAKQRDAMELKQVGKTVTPSEKLYINKAGDRKYINVRDTEAVKIARIAGYRPHVAGAGVKETALTTNVQFLLDNELAETKQEAYRMAKELGTKSKRQFLMEARLRLEGNQYLRTDEIDERMRKIEEWYNTLGKETPDELADMPSASDNKGRVITDTTTGKRYRSDGTNWVEIE